MVVNIANRRRLRSTSTLLTRIQQLYTGSVQANERSLDKTVQNARRVDNPIADISAKSVGVYIHWPYCRSKCSYCDFNRYVRDTVDHDRMRKSFLMELQHSLDLCGAERVHSVFFGGGTPTLAEPETLAAVIDSLSSRGLFETKNGSVEVTMEGNPTSSESLRLSEFKAAGVNRLSLGIQALSSARDLQFLGRNHSITDALAAIERAKTLFPGRLSIDLIFGRPDQTRDDWRSELKDAITVADDHISIYQLTIEKGTPLHRKHIKGELQLPDEDLMADFYDDVWEITGEAGFECYEVSNFARPGAECRHNTAYWQGLDYIGIGPGAHSRHMIRSKSHNSFGSRCARVQALQPEEWMSTVERNGHGTRLEKQQSLYERAAELLMLGLRTRSGVLNSTWNSVICTQGGPSLWNISHQPICARLVRDGFLCTDDYGLYATNTGIRILDGILPNILTALDGLWPPST